MIERGNYVNVYAVIPDRQVLQGETRRIARCGAERGELAVSLSAGDDQDGAVTSLHYIPAVRERAVGAEEILTEGKSGA